MLTESQIEAFAVDGVVLAGGALEPEWIAALRAALPALLGTAYDSGERIGDVRPGAVANDGMWRTNATFARFLVRSPVGGLATAAMRSGTARLYEDLLLHSEPGVAGAGWHRDAPHWPVAGHQLSSTWFSLESATRDTGALRFVAGSHLDGDEIADEGLMPAFDPAAQTRPILEFDTEPGDVIVFHPRILHAAPGAAPDRPRRTFTLRFLGDDVRWRPRRSLYHEWMGECGFAKGDVLDHPWFPVIAGR